MSELGADCFVCALGWGWCSVLVGRALRIVGAAGSCRAKDTYYTTIDEKEYIEFGVVAEEELRATQSVVSTLDYMHNMVNTYIVAIVQESRSPT